LGNIRQINIKNIEINLLEKYPKEFIVRGFQHNKVKVAGLTNVKNKHLRNRNISYGTKSLSLDKKIKKCM
jgi:ribosomal protein S17E